ncbi:AAA-like domain-containing protein [Leptolyngbya sp. O-77]|uniref:AAA-like domain-containing protein n=1 Tax=Leptolyngbya sp. O-77 TaxID=1080068 RepID=UPI00074D2CE9|nr:AAA-like domain-containing protein [Leptolyngbya sp. O-77]BAU41485.1 hypothetical protein O77CONTIG1_01295 [Leptolyngbya sp. O-77]
MNPENRDPEKQDLEKRRIAKRKRGIVLSEHGLSRLQAAIARLEAEKNGGDRYSAEALSELADVSPSSIRRLWAAQAGVDQKTLRKIFSTFGLTLTDADLQPVDGFSPATLSQPFSQALSQPQADGSLARSLRRYPSGPLPLQSSLYIYREPIEALAFREITQVGCVVRIKAPPGFGKTSLLLRMLDQAQQLGYAIASIDLQQAETDILENPNQFLQWFSRSLAMKLGLVPPPENPWGEAIGISFSTTLYVRDQLLSSIQRPVLLAINAIDRVFAHPATAQAFLPLLRSWHEEAGHDAVWQHLRLVVTYATDCYLPLDIIFSPFNVGLPLALPEFTPDQVLELAQQYALSWSESDANRLMAWVGGHPTLVHLAIYHIANQRSSLDVFLEAATTPQGVYQRYLQTMFAPLQELPWTMEPLKSPASDSRRECLDPPAGV